MAIELGVGYLSIVGETSRLGPSINKALRGVNATVNIDTSKGASDAARNGKAAGSQFGDSFSSSLQSKISGSGSGVKAALTSVISKAGAVAAGAGVALSIGSVLTSGFDRLTAIDEAQTKLKALGNDAQSVKEIMTNATAAVKGTAYGLDAAATTAASAVAAGIKPGQDLTKYLTTTADAAAVAGVSMSEMGSIMNKVTTNGKAMTDDLQQLGDRGLPIFQWIGKEMGVSADQVADLASKSKISSEVFRKAIENNINGAAKEMGGSIKGSIANAKAAFSRFGAEALKPVMAVLPGALDALTNFADSAGKAVGPAFSAVGDAFRKVAETVGAAVGFIRENSTAFGVLASVVGGALLPVTATWVALFAKANIQMALYAARAAAAAAVTKGIAAAQWLLNAALSANPIGLIISAVAGLVAGLTYFFTQTETGKKVWSSVWGFIKSTTASVVDWFRTTALPFLQGIWSGIKAAWDAVYPGLKAGFDGFRTAISLVGNVLTWLWQTVAVPAFQSIGAVVGVFWSGVQVVFAAFGAANRLLGQAIMWLWQNVAVPAFAGIRVVAEAMWNLVRPIWEAFKLGLQVVGDAISWLWNNVAVPGFNAIKDAAKTMWDLIKPIWQGFKSGVDMAVNAAVAFKNGVIDAFNKVKDVVTSVWNAIKKPFEMMSSGLGAVRGFLDGVGRSGGGGVPGRAAGGPIGFSHGGLPAFAGGGGAGVGANGVLFGPGTTTSDSILALLSRGEFIINAKQTAKFLPLIQAINSDSLKLPGFAEGGIPGAMASLVQKRWPSIQLTSGKRSSNDNHGKGWAGDFSNGSGNTDEQLQLAQWIAKNFPNSAELIYSDPRFSGNIKNGKNVGDGNSFYGADTMAQHRNHVHWAMSSAPSDPGDGVDESGNGGRSASGSGSASGGGSFGGLGGGSSSGGGFGGGSAFSSAAAAKQGGVVPVWVENWPAGGSLAGTSVSTGAAPADSALSSAVAANTSAQTAGLSKQQQYADAIVAEGKRRGVSEKGILAALATVQVESGFKMYANNADPESLKFAHDAVGSDYDSSGLFQQRNNGAWGTIADRMDPAKSAGMFYDQLKGFDYENMDIGAAAQKVQRSAFPDKYGKQVGVAQEMLSDSLKRVGNGNALNVNVASIDSPAGKALADAQPAQVPATSAATSAADGAASGQGSNAGDPAELGKILGGGLLESFGFDGSLFKNPMEWPFFQLLQNLMKVGPQSGGQSGGLLGALAGNGAGMFSNAPQVAGGAADAVAGDGSGALIAGIGDYAVSAMQGVGPAGAVNDNSININGNVGMNPQEVISTVDKKQNERSRTYSVSGQR